MKKEKITRSSGNVFADLQIADQDQYLAKAKLAVMILEILQTRMLTQIATSKLLGLGQPKVSALLNGRLDGFSTDRLFCFLNALGCDVKITVSKSHEGKAGQVKLRLDE